MFGTIVPKWQIHRSGPFATCTISGSVGHVSTTGGPVSCPSAVGNSCWNLTFCRVALLVVVNVARYAISSS